MRRFMRSSAYWRTRNDSLRRRLGFVFLGVLCGDRAFTTKNTKAHEVGASRAALPHLARGGNPGDPMTSPQILAATLAAAYLYVVTPGPAFLALFTLAASRGRVSGAWFITGHLVGDVTWGALAVAAIVGANRIGPAVFELLGFVCGLYLIYLGFRAVTTRKDSKPRTIGASRPLCAVA